MTALARYLELEEKLTEFIAQGKGDSEEADEIRDGAIERARVRVAADVVDRLIVARGDHVHDRDAIDPHAPSAPRLAGPVHRTRTDANGLGGARDRDAGRRNGDGGAGLGPDRPRRDAVDGRAGLRGEPGGAGDAAARGVHLAADEVEERRLPGAVAAEDAPALAVRDHERDVAQQLARAEPHGHPGQGD